MSELRNLQQKVQRYYQLLEDTTSYRNIWNESLRDFIVDTLKKYTDEVDLKCTIDIRDRIKGMETIILDLGKSESGMYEELDAGGVRTTVKLNGSLVYQQLFNGKIGVWINYPFIESNGQPTPAKMVAIYRPEELKEPFIARHLEEFIQEIIAWEDYDDDKPQSIGFQSGIGFKPEEHQS